MVVSGHLNLPAAFFWRKLSPNLLNGALHGHQSPSGNFRENTTVIPLMAIQHRLLGLPALSLVTARLKCTVGTLLFLTCCKISASTIPTIIMAFVTACRILKAGGVFLRTFVLGRYWFETKRTASCPVCCQSTVAYFTGDATVHCHAAKRMMASTTVLL
jgi:hypothetical protein